MVVERTFASGDEVSIGRDIRADVRVPQPVVSRVHVLLRYSDGHWVATDNDSMNGMFVDGRRVGSVEIRDGQTLHIGEPDGPGLTFEFGISPDERPTTPTKLESDDEADASSVATNVVRVLRPGARPAPPPGSTTIGRAPDNNVVIPDVLASRPPRLLGADGAGRRDKDAGSMNGTFVNGQRVKDARLRENDVVTIGNRRLGLRQRHAGPSHGTRRQDRWPRGARVSVTIEGNRTLLDRYFVLRRAGHFDGRDRPVRFGQVHAVEGITGGTWPDRGTVLFEGRDLHAEYASLRSRIGMVPQDDVVHRQLTVNQALGYAAELRMPPDTTKQDRQRVINQVLEELELTPHARQTYGQAVGGQRKRASVALELLTGPSLLVLDEPTTGLDPALDQQVMKMLRQLADAGRVVVVVTHSLAHLDICDQVLLLAPGGKTAFRGPPGDIGPAMGTTDWADIFTAIGADPDAAQRRFLERSSARVDARRPAAATETTGTVGQTRARQLVAAVLDDCTTPVAAARCRPRLLLVLVLLPFLVGCCRSPWPACRLRQGCL